METIHKLRASVFVKISKEEDVVLNYISKLTHRPINYYLINLLPNILVSDNGKRAREWLPRDDGIFHGVRIGAATFTASLAARSAADTMFLRQRLR